MASAKTRSSSARKRPTRKWSRRVMETSDALDLDRGVFKKSPRAMAQSLKRSAERSTRRKASPFRSAMSMLVFYENRGGRNLSAEDRRRLERAKDELRALFQRPERKPRRAAPRRSSRPRSSQKHSRRK